MPSPPRRRVPSASSTSRCRTPRPSPRCSSARRRICAQATRSPRPWRRASPASSGANCPAPEPLCRTPRWLRCSWCPAKPERSCLWWRRPSRQAPSRKPDPRRSPCARMPSGNGALADKRCWPGRFFVESSMPSRFQQRHRARGWFLISAMLGLTILSLAPLYLFREQHARTQAALAQVQADTIGAIRTAAEILVFEHYADYQQGNGLTRGSVSLAWGNSPGQALRPTVAQLAQMNLGIDGISDVGSYQSLAQAGYDISIQRAPAGCELSPHGVDCSITGLVCTDRPVRDLNDRAEVDSFGIGKMLLRIGGNAGTSVLGGTGEIIGSGGGWSQPNPIAGAPAGIVCARFGYGVAEYWNFLRVRDTRDPQFMNDVTLRGALHVRSTAVQGATCTTPGMALWGQTEGKPVWLQCSNGLWQPGNGLAYAAEGDSCAEDADFGLTTGNVALVCSNGTWVSQAQIGLRSAAYYQHGATVPHPACRAGLSPPAVLAAGSASNIIGADNTRNNTRTFH